MGVDATMLGSGTSSAPTNAANFVQLVSCSSSAAEKSSNRFPPNSGIPGWKRLIDHPLTRDERVSLITTVFSDRDEIEAVKRICRDDAQSFVNVIDEVLLHSSI